MRKAIFLSFASMFASLSFAQVPTITSVSPPSGNVGTAVIITGSGFSPVAENNVVFFGAVAAEVASATATQLNTIVPSGATYEPITVVVGGSVVQAANAFRVTFPTYGGLSESSFSAPMSFNTDANTTDVAIADLDSDGKSDLIISSGSLNTIRVLHNTYTTGAPPADWFDDGTNFDTDTNTVPLNLFIADVDGDGKLDIVIRCTYGISIFRNISTPGSIAIAASYNMAVSNVAALKLADVDGDGKQDMVAQSGTGPDFLLFRNTSTAGTIDASTFAAPAAWGVTYGVNGFVIADLDGDGRVDIALSHRLENRLALYRNIGVAGTLNATTFDSRVEINITQPWRMLGADLNNDGKPELIVTRYVEHDFVVYENVAASGVLTATSFVDPVAVSSSVSTGFISIADLDGDGFGDVIGEDLLTIHRNKFSGVFSSESFAPSMGLNSSYLSGVTFGDLNNDGKPEIVKVDGGSAVAVLINQTITPVNAPAIDDFNPKQGYVGTTVTIEGENFSTTASDNIVFFGPTKAEVVTASSTQLTVEVPAGAAYHNITVTIDGLTAESLHSFIPTFPNYGGISKATFRTPVDFTVDGGQDAVLSDLDGDGKPEMIVIGSTFAKARVFRNLSVPGAAIASYFDIGTDFAIPGGAFRVVAADIDGDGKQDVVVLNGSVVSILRNNSTPGVISLEAHVEFATQTNPYNVVVADLDADGKPDIAVANHNSMSISLFHNLSVKGAIDLNSMGAPSILPLGFTINDLDIGDVDGDGKPDFVTAYNGSDRIAIIRNVGERGQLAALSFAPGFTTDITNPELIKLGDVDLDGKLDIIVNANDEILHILRNSSIPGTIDSQSMEAPVTFASGGVSIHNLTLGDVDGDGKADIMAVSQNNIAAIHPNVSVPGAITPTSFLSPSYFGSSSSPVSKGVIGDLDGDGKPELVIVSSAKVFVLVNHALTPADVPTITSFSPAKGEVGSIVTITGTNFGLTPGNNFVYFGPTRAEVLTATATQLTVEVPAGTVLGTITVTTNAGLTAESTKSFMPAFLSIGGISKATFNPPVDFNIEGGRDVTFSDLDGDGKPEMIVISDDIDMIRVFRNESDPSAETLSYFADGIDYATPANPFRILAADMDGDGKQDIVLLSWYTVSIFRNTSTLGNISLDAHVDFSDPGDPYYMVITDLDADGKPDIALANDNSKEIALFRNLSVPGTIDAESLASPGNLLLSSNMYDIAGGDIDGDGKTDLVVLLGDDRIGMLRNLGARGQLSPASFAALVSVTVNNPTNVILGDVDLDGKLDLIVGRDDDYIEIFRNVSTSGTIDGTSMATSKTYNNGGGEIHGIALSDIDGDGKPDVVATSRNDVATVHRNLSVAGGLTPSSFQQGVVFDGLDANYGTVGDLDGDGKPEVVTVSNSKVSVFVNRTLAPSVAPKIISIAPTLAEAGVTITITGSGFGTTEADNTIYIGSTLAEITSASSTELTATVPFGSTGLPVSVSTGGKVARSQQVFNYTYPSDRVVNISSFGSRSDIATDSGPGALAAADMDGDGMVDLIVANVSVDKVTIYRNISDPNSPSTYAFDAGVAFATPDGPYELEIADLDGDGRLDLAVGCYASRLSVFRNVTTPGAFSASSLETRLDYVTYDAAQGLAIDDLDADGKPEIVMGTSYDTWVFKNMTTGGAFKPTSFLGMTMGFIASRDLTTADMDNDGKPELLITRGDMLAIYKNNTSVGSILPSDFSVEADFTVNNPGVIAVSDFNEDSKPDVVVRSNSDSYNHIIAVFANTSANGVIDAHTLSDPQVYNINSIYVEAVTISDVDGDGHQDLVAAGRSGLTIFRNNFTPTFGASSFGDAITLSLDYESVGVVRADLNGDGKQDLAATQNFNQANIAIYLNTNDVTPDVPAITAFSPRSGPIGTTVIISGSNFSPTPTDNVVYFGATRATVVTATSTEITVEVPTGATYKPISVATSGRLAWSALPFLVTFPDGILDQTSFGSSIELPGGGYGAIQLTDLDLDGKADITATDTYSSTHIVLAYANASTIGAIDASSFPVRTDFNTSAGSGLEIADMDGDGRNDLVTANFNPALISVFLSSGMGPLSASSLASEFLLSPGANVNAILARDMDNDGRADLVIGRSGAIEILRSRSTIGSLKFEPRISLATQPGNGSLAAGDLDLDGKIDLVVSQNNSIAVLYNTSVPGAISANSFAAPLTFVTGTTAPSGITLADIDGDGRMEILVANSGDDTFSVLYNQSSPGVIDANSFAGKVDFAVSPSPVQVEPADLDGDGRVDLVVRNNGEAYYTLFRNTGTTGPITATTFGTGFHITAGDNTGGIAIGDLDGDGKPEVLSSGYISGAVITVFHNQTAPIPDITLDSQTGSTTVCEGSDATLTIAAVGTTNITYQWQRFNGSKYVDLATIDGYTGTNTATLTFSTAGNFGAGDYRCLLTGDLAAPVTSDVASVTISGVPSQPVIAVSGQNVLCNGASATLTAPPGFASYLWSNSATSQTISVEETGEYSVIVANAAGCQSTSSEHIAITSSTPPLKPEVTVVGSDVICNNSFVVLAAPEGHTTYLWSNGETTRQVVITVAGDYTVQVGAALSCLSPVSDPKTVTETSECAGGGGGIPPGHHAPFIEPATFGVALQSTGSFPLVGLLSDADNNLDTTSLTIVTPPASGATATIDSDGVLQLDYRTTKFSGEEFITIGVCDTDPICTVRQLTIEVVGEVVVYNGLTPDGDGYNDFMVIQYVDVVANGMNNRVMIFNRWGDLVFDIDGYNNVDKVFTGLNNSGQELESGSYFYQIEIAAEKYSGYITIKR